MAEAHVSLTAAAKPATPAAARRHLALGVDVLKLGHSAFAKPKSKWLVLGGKAGEERLQWAASAVEMPSGRDVKLSSVTRIQLAQEGKTFAKHRKRLFAKRDMSLTIECATGPSLDIVFANQQQFDTWLHAFVMLVCQQSSQFREHHPELAPKREISSALVALDDVIALLEGALEPTVVYRGGEFLEQVHKSIDQLTSDGGATGS